MIKALFSTEGKTYEGVWLGEENRRSAMLYITVKEVFPEAYSEGRTFATTLGFLAGVLLMLFLDTVSF